VKHTETTRLSHPDDQDEQVDIVVALQKHVVRLTEAAMPYLPWLDSASLDGLSDGNTPS
jgi:hypothetical protein